MRRERRAGRFAVTRHDIYDAVRDAGFLNDFAQQKRGERGLLGGLEHHGAAGGEGRPKLPCRHQQGEIPRDDLPDHANGFAEGVGQKSAPPEEIGIVLPSILVAQPAM